MNIMCGFCRGESEAEEGEFTCSFCGKKMIVEITDGRSTIHPCPDKGPMKYFRLLKEKRLLNKKQMKEELTEEEKERYKILKDKIEEMESI